MPGPRRTTIALLLLLAAAAVGVAILVRPDAPAPPDDAHRNATEAPAEGPRLTGATTTPEAAPKPPEGDAAETKGPRNDARGRLLVTVQGTASAGVVRGARVTARFADGTRRHALTNAQGQAAFEPTVPGVATVWTEAGDLRCAVESWPLERGHEHSVDLALSSAIRLAGRVLDARTGRGIEGAVVGVDQLRGDWWRGPGPGAGTTDASGRFEAWCVYTQRRWSFADAVVAALAPGYALGLASIDWPWPEEGPIRLTFRLEPGGTIAGSVVRPDGTPAAGAEVALLPQIEDWVPPPLPDDLQGRVDARLHGATTDAHGRFEVWGLPLGGTFSAVATADGFARSRAVRDLRPTDTRPSCTARLVLGACARVRVRVLDPDGDPVMDAHVALVDVPETWGTTDEEGLAKGWAVAPGRHVVRVTAAGHPPVSENALLPGGELTEVVIHLDPGFGIAGVLVDARGEPAPSRWVQAWALDGGVRGQAWTDDAGRFRIDGLAALPHRLRCGSGELPRPGPVVTAPAQGIRMVLPPQGWLRIRLRASPDVERPQQIGVRYGEGDLQGLLAAKSSPTRGGGLIHVCRVPAGRRTFRIEPPKHAPVVLELDVPSGERPLDVEVPLGPGLVLEGRVVDGAGRPVAGAWVSVVDRQGTDTQTDADGRFRISRLAPEPVVLHVHADGTVPVEVTHRVDPEIPPTTIVLRRGGVLRGRVVDESGEGVAGAGVSIRSVDEPDDVSRSFFATTDELGAFRTRVLPGTWLVGLDRVHGFVPQAEVTIETDGDAEVDLVAADG